MVNRVLNKRTDKIPPGAVYIGRPSKWGNPFKIGETVAGGYRVDRLGAIELYRRHILQNKRLLEALAELRGKDLVCWCAPKPCHGDILLKLANSHEGEGK